jgi:hypothetical protein
MNRWENNEIQFPRLLAEIFGILTNEQIDFLCESMDLTADDIDELFHRANLEWEKIKANLNNDHH